MRVCDLMFTASLLFAAPALAQTAAQQRAQNASNWDVFLKLYPKRAISYAKADATRPRVSSS